MVKRTGAERQRLESKKLELRMALIEGELKALLDLNRLVHLTQERLDRNQRALFRAFATHIARQPAPLPVLTDTR